MSSTSRARQTSSAAPGFMASSTLLPPATGGGGHFGWQWIGALYSPKEQRLTALATLLSLGGLAASVGVVKHLSRTPPLASNPKEDGEEEEIAEHHEEEEVAGMGPFMYVLRALNRVAFNTRPVIKPEGLLLAGVSGKGWAPGMSHLAISTGETMAR